MSHLESLIAEYLDWQGYLVRRNVKVGRLRHGGWEMELDVIAYQPRTGDLVHYEPSLDAHSWATRERRYAKKISAARRLILREVFPWLPRSTRVRHVAIFSSHPAGRDRVAGALVRSVDEFVAEVRGRVIAQGPAIRSAISESYPLLRTLQLSHCGYTRAR